MRRIGTHNVNGIRAALRRGYAPGGRGRTPTSSPCRRSVAGPTTCRWRPSCGYHATLDTGTLVGRNGVAVLTRQIPSAVRTLGGTVTTIDPHGAQEHTEVDRLVSRDLAPFAREGRYVEVDLSDTQLTVASLYLPKGRLALRGQLAGEVRPQDALHARAGPAS